MPKCQNCGNEFEKEGELEKHQSERRRCIGCCHILCECCVNPIKSGVRVIRCCQCGKTNY